MSAYYHPLGEVLATVLPAAARAVQSLLLPQEIVGGSRSLNTLIHEPLGSSNYWISC